MSHHHHHVHARDRALVLRIMVPSLRTALRDKMAALDQKVASEQETARQKARVQAQQAQASLGSMSAMSAALPAVPPDSKAPSTHILDLDGVSCAPLADGSTLWSFRCDGMTYPARLVNLPCPVEIHKTFDHATYHKCSDVGQILIVYEDMTHLEESESVPGYKVEGYPSYYHSGLTPPMKRVVERRFNSREHKSVAPPRSEIAEVEKELKSLIDRTEKGTGKGKGKGGGVGQGKPIEEVVDDVVDYEPWMDDHGRQPYGITFDEKDIMATKHPEVWLDPKDLKEEKEVPAGITAAAAAAAASAKRLDTGDGTSKKSKKKKDKKDGSEKKKKKKKAKAAETELPPVEEKHVKKGIPSLKTREAQAAAAAAAAAAANTGEVDEVTQVATQIANMEDNDEDLLALDDFFNFDGDDEFADMDLS